MTWTVPLSAGCGGCVGPSSVRPGPARGVRESEREALADHVGEPVARPRGPASSVGASTITRTSGSVPEGRSRTRPRPPSSASSAATAAASDGSSSARVLSTSGDVDQHLGQPGHHRRRATAGPCPWPTIRCEHVQRGEDAVAGGGVLAHDDVAGLLAAERVAGGPHRLEHVAVADRGLPHADARASIACTKPRLLITVATTVSSASRPRSRSASARIARIWSPSTTLPVVVDGQAAVGVAVEGEADVGAVLDHGRLERLEVGRAAAVVDVEAVGLGVDRDHLGAGAAQRQRPGLGRRAVGAVDDDLEAGRAGGRWCRRRWATYSSIGRVVRAHPADRGAGRALPGLAQPRLDRDLDRVVELVAAAGEELDAVVGHRVVGGADDITPRSALERVGQVGDAGRRQHAEPHARRRPAEARPATTAASRNCPEMRGSRPTTANGRSRPARTRRASTSDVGRGTDRSRASSAVRSPLARPRTPSVPKSRGHAAQADAARISACCTAAPCGPS